MNTEPIGYWQGEAIYGCETCGQDSFAHEPQEDGSILHLCPQHYYERWSERTGLR